MTTTNVAPKSEEELRWTRAELAVKDVCDGHERLGQHLDALRLYGLDAMSTGEAHLLALAAAVAGQAAEVMTWQQEALARAIEALNDLRVVEGVSATQQVTSTSNEELQRQIDELRRALRMVVALSSTAVDCIGQDASAAAEGAPS